MRARWPAIFALLGCLFTYMMLTKSVFAVGPAGVDTGLELWFSADSGAQAAGAVDATDGQAVVTWLDQSTESRTATRQDATGATFSATGLNYNPTLEFNDNNYTFSNTDLPDGADDRSIFVVASTNDIGSWRYVLGTGTFGGNGGFDFGNRAGSGVVFITTHSAQEGQTGSWSPLGTARLAYGAVTGGTLYIGVNGAALVSGGSGVNTVLDAAANIGANSGGSERWYGSISEVIMFNRTVSDTERQRVNSYLALKYGFSLDQTTPQSYLASGSNLMWDKDATGAGTYNNGLFGIGRDDSSNLAQLKSRGQTSTNVIILEADGEGSNGNPSFNDIANLEFLVIGDNNGAASWTTTGAPSGYSILSRQWKKQEQGDVGSVILDFDVADSDFNIPTPLDNDDYYFIYDTDNDNSLADETPLAMSDEGSNLWRTTVNFGTGGIFSLASTENPAITSLSPADNDTGIIVSSNLVITFNKNVTAGSGNITIKKTSDDSVFETIAANDSKVTGNGTATITINPSGTLGSNTGYYILIDSTAFEDGSSNFFPGISSTQAWNFTTQIIAPTATSTPTPTGSISSPSNTTTSSPSVPSCTAEKPHLMPNLFQIDVSNTQARIYFTPLMGNVTNYYVAYGYTPTDERFGAMTNHASSNGVLSFVINELSPNITYYFKVRPHNDCMPGEWSNTMKVTTSKNPTGAKFYKGFMTRLFSVFPKHITEVKSGDVLGISTKADFQSNCREHVVTIGDSLWKIAAQYLGSGPRYSAIISDNNLSSTILRLGQKIKVGC